MPTRRFEKDDGKLQKLIDVLKASDGLFSVDKNTDGKLVIFSEAIETGRVLKRVIEKIAKKKVLLLTSKNRKKREEEIIANFDANYQKEKQKNDVDVIITTDVLAEGVNLHRSNTILNYDVPWNATKLIQRIGRINRVDGIYSDLYVYNFYPSNAGDSEINLVQKAYTKLQAFHTMFGGDSKIFSEEELTEGKFDDAITEEKTDGEESEAERYIKELKEFKRKNSALYEKIEKLKTCEDKTLKREEPTEAIACFAIKNGRQTVYKKLNYNEMGYVEAVDISYAEMFEMCRPQNENASLALTLSNANNFRKKALAEYNKHRNKNMKKERNKNRASLLIAKSGHDFISKYSTILSPEIKDVLVEVINAIRNGNDGLARKLNDVISSIEDEKLKRDEINILISERLDNYKRKTLDECKQKTYIMASFYFM